ncbi:tetratricopeptide repeat protein [Streptomyces sp. NPDC001984]|uniref:tetratricopeptide repeat protein n=1 Tax=Streptomyces sp. NPDC002619 TaxID=3364655 RepID=UPI0036BB19FE
MSRLSREGKREQWGAGHSVTPVDVRVTGAAGATADGVRLVAAPGEEIQQAVLDHLHHLALTNGHPVLATIHDDRIGYVVPLQVNPDGSSQFASDPVGMAAVGEPARDDVPTLPTPGTVQAPTGVFGPPPVMPPKPEPTAVPTPTHTQTATPTPTPRPHPTPDLLTAREPDPKPTPARGFDAVAEAVLGDGAEGAAEDGVLGEPMGRINAAVRAGRIEDAAGLAERTVGEASAALGPEHPEVLRLRELTAYIAYLAGDPLRSFEVSLELARLRRRARDGEAAYGNVQSAATAWRAVRDPEQGLRLGEVLIALWTELTAEEGPAADDVEELESARARMHRLTARAGRQPR